VLGRRELCLITLLSGPWKLWFSGVCFGANWFGHIGIYLRPRCWFNLTCSFQIYIRSRMKFSGIIIIFTMRMQRTVILQRCLSMNLMASILNQPFLDSHLMAILMFLISDVYVYVVMYVYANFSSWRFVLIGFFFFSFFNIINSCCRCSKHFIMLQRGHPIKSIWC